MALPKYNTAYSTTIALINQSTGNFQGNPTLAAGDVKVILDDSDPVNITTLPSLLIGGGNTKILTVNLSAPEMSGDRVQVMFSDVAGSEWRDAIINIDIPAYNPDDFVGGSTVVNANVLQIGSSTTAATNLRDVSLGVQSGLIVTSGSNTSSTFKTNLTGVNDAYGNGNGGGVLLFTGGALAGQSKRVTGFVNSTAFITVESAFTATPSVSDPFTVVGHIEV